ncbi:hypothetical protein, partial [Arenibacter lacus]|uniref:hypothetical protein n=1 Tax=Arenibacter lacus TaxID=2608629 RepID=UPI00168B12E6
KSKNRSKNSALFKNKKLNLGPDASGFKPILRIRKASQVDLPKVFGLLSPLVANQGFFASAQGRRPAAHVHLSESGLDAAAVENQ